MRLRLLAAVSALAVTTTTGLAACGGGGPSATSLAAKLGCGNVTQAPQNPPAQQDIDCNLNGDGSAVEIATFGSSSDRDSWIHSQPAAACCAEGELWAATVTLGGSGSASTMLHDIAVRLDGRQVSPSS
jgi:hypothetical protein